MISSNNIIKNRDKYLWQFQFWLSIQVYILKRSMIFFKISYVLVCKGWHNKYYRLDSLNNRNLLSQVLEDRNPVSRCLQGWLPLSPFPGLQIVAFSLCYSHTFSLWEMEKITMLIPMRRHQEEVYYFQTKRIFRYKNCYYIMKKGPLLQKT